MGHSHSSRYARLVAAFAASALALLMLATAQYESTEASLASLSTARLANSQSDTAISGRIQSFSRCGRAMATRNREMIARVCKGQTNRRDSR